jgi:outer membrane protein assembly factor BamB
MLCRTLVVVVLLFHFAALGADPPGGSPLYPDLTIAKPRVLWKHLSETELREDGTSHVVGVGSPTYFDGTLYYGNDLGKLRALSADDGRVLWTHYHGSRIYWAPTADKDHVYFESEQGCTAVRRSDGTEVWRHAMKDGGAPPVVHGEQVYAAGNDGQAYALDRATGKVLWKHDFLKDAPPDQPGFDGKTARVGDNPARPCGGTCDGELWVQCVFDQSRVIAIDCKTGERRWSFQTGGWVWSPPTITAEHVYITSQDAHLYCVERATGKEVWKYKTPGWFQSEVVVHDGKVYCTHHRGRLYQLDALTGKELKKFESDDPEKSLGGSGLLLNGKVAYYAVTKGTLFALDLEKNEPLWTYRPVEQSELALAPVTDGKRIFLSVRQDIKREGVAGIVAVGEE